MRFIVISSLPDTIAGPLNELRLRIGERAGAVEALRYPPHITLRTGLVCPDSEAEAVARSFLAHAKTFPAFPVQAMEPIASSYTDDDGTRHGFLAYRIRLSKELAALHRHLVAFTEWRKGPQGPFEPHLSLCYKDVSPEAVLELGEEFKEPILSLLPAWRLERVELWREAEGRWVEYASARLAAS